MEIVKHGDLNWKCREKHPEYYSFVPFVALYECYNCGEKLAILETVDTDSLGSLASDTGFSSEMDCPTCQDDMRTVALDKPVLVLCTQEKAASLLSLHSKGTVNES